MKSKGWQQYTEQYYDGVQILLSHWPVTNTLQSANKSKSTTWVVLRLTMLCFLISILPSPAFLPCQAKKYAFIYELL